MTSIKVIASSNKLYPIKEPSIDKQSKIILRLIIGMAPFLKLLPTFQRHFVFLFFKDYPGQYIAIAVAGSQDWSDIDNNLTMKNQRNINDMEIRMWTINARYNALT